MIFHDHFETFHQNDHDNDNIFFSKDFSLNFFLLLPSWRLLSFQAKPCQALRYKIQTEIKKITGQKLKVAKLEYNTFQTQSHSWTNHEQLSETFLTSLNSLITLLRRKFGQNQNFADVTLAREDGQHGEEHKVILAGQVLFHYLTHSIITSTSAVGKRLQVLSCHISLYSGTCGR